MRIAILAGFALTGVLTAGDWRAGVSKIEITPQGPIWMAGYAARTKPSEGVIAPLFAKALAMEDAKKSRVIFVGTDVIGIPRVVADEIAVQALKQFGVERRELVLNSSHTHSGPVIWPNLSTMYPMNEAQRADVQAYTRTFIERVVQAIGAAIGDLKPANVDSAIGKAEFAVHRRLPGEKGIQLAPNPAGPVDHAVPTVQVRGPDGKLRAVLFGYSCHNTTMTGQFYQLNGDYAGFAQAELEAKYTGAAALFATGCAGDQNPNPRSSLELAKRHGSALAAAVSKAVEGPREELKGRIKTRFQLIDLPFQYFAKDDFEKELQSANPVAVARAKEMLRAFETRNVKRRLPYPIQGVRLGQLTIVALGGEVVVEYCLRLRRELGIPNLFVMAYSNDVMCYIPTKQQIAEGGYEAKDSFLYYGTPAPLAADVEEEIVTRVKQLVAKMK
jgi:neutral ceramidase